MIYYIIELTVITLDDTDLKSLKKLRISALSIFLVNSLLQTILVSYFLSQKFQNKRWETKIFNVTLYAFSFVKFVLDLISLIIYANNSKHYKISAGLGLFCVLDAVLGFFLWYVVIYVDHKKESKIKK